MRRYVANRAIDAGLTIWLVLTLVFFAMRVLPGDPALAALGDQATTEQLAAFRALMGLNEGVNVFVDDQVNVIENVHHVMIY